MADQDDERKHPDWQVRREAARGRHAARHDDAESRRYASMPCLGVLDPVARRAYLDDLLAAIRIVQAHCDQPGDAALFPAGSFDVVASRQTVNGLHDPLAAFRHWHHWLKPGGLVVVIDGLYGRDDWQGDWAEEVDVLPSTRTPRYVVVAER